MATSTSFPTVAGLVDDSSTAFLLPTIIAVGILAGLLGSITIGRLTLIDGVTTGAVAGLATAIVYVGLLVAVSR